MANFLCFEDYRCFIRSLWPHGNESDDVREKLWQLSTYQCASMFINGKPLTIEYNFDSSRIKEDRILINYDSLLPVFGGIVPPAIDKFQGVPKLRRFVKMHVHLDMCSEGERAYCPCNLVNEDGRGYEVFVKPPVDACEYGHFHHYCSQHVSNWLNILEKTLITFRQMQEFFDEDIVKAFVLSLDDAVYVRGIEMRRRGPLLYRVVH